MRKVLSILLLLPLILGGCQGTKTISTNKPYENYDYLETLASISDILNRQSHIKHFLSTSQKGYTKLDDGTTLVAIITKNKKCTIMGIVNLQGIITHLGGASEKCDIFNDGGKNLLKDELIEFYSKHPIPETLDKSPKIANYLKSTFESIVQHLPQIVKGEITTKIETDISKLLRNDRTTKESAEKLLIAYKPYLEVEKSYHQEVRKIILEKIQYDEKIEKLLLSRIEESLGL